MTYYSREDKDKLKAQLVVISIKYGAKTHGSVVERIAILKGKKLTKNEIELLKKLSEALEISYSELRPVYPEEQ